MAREPMMKKKASKPTRIVSFAAVLFAAAACTDSPLAPTVEQAPRIELDRESVLADSHQEIITFTARVLDATGQEVDSVPLEWETDNPDVLEDMGDGSFRTLSDGTAAVTVRVPQAHGSVAPWGYFANIPDAEALVQVEQAASHIALFTEESSEGAGRAAEAVDIWAIDQVVGLAPRATDDEGQLVDGMSLSGLAWSSDDESVFTVDEHGNITPVGDGEATIRVSGEGLSGETVVRIRATQNIRTCATLWIGGAEGSDSEVESCSSLLLTFTRGG